MLYGVFSDVHSNLEALSAVLTFFSKSKVEGYICCGDLVGYGPDPNTCLEWIQPLKNLSIICGNHDLAAIGRLEPEWFNPYARAAVLWTQKELSPRSRAYLEKLSARLDAPNFTLTHGSPRRPVEEYLLSPAQLQHSLPQVKVWPLFVGHSHFPLCFQVNPKGEIAMSFLEEGQTVKTQPLATGASPIVFNPGSVGQPRDQDKRASCALYDSVAGTYSVARLEYDVAATQAKIRAAGLPEFLALRLAYGQ